MSITKERLRLLPCVVGSTLCSALALAGGVGQPANTHSLRGTFGQSVVGRFHASEHSIHAGFWATVPAVPCFRPERLSVYSNTHEVDFWWSTLQEFGDAVRLPPPATGRTTTGVRMPLLNTNSSTWTGDIVLRLYWNTPDLDALVYERSYKLVLPPGQSTATLALPNTEITGVITCTIEGLPASILAGWNDAPVLGSSSDSFWVRDFAVPGSGWTLQDFGGAPSIANLSMELVGFSAARGDTDGNGVVDGRDLFSLLDCLAGPGIPAAPSCRCGPDSDDNGAVDLRDFAAFQADFGGGCSMTVTGCDDANACTTEVCDAGTGACTYSAISCEDGDVCTVDRCDPDVGCVVTPALCGDADGCCPQGCVFGDGDKDCCRPMDAPCTSDAQCCSQRCPNGTCKCSRKDEPCTSDDQCCSRSCRNNGSCR